MAQSNENNHESFRDNEADAERSSPEVAFHEHVKEMMEKAINDPTTFNSILSNLQQAGKECGVNPVKVYETVVCVLLELSAVKADVRSELLKLLSRFELLVQELRCNMGDNMDQPGVNAAIANSLLKLKEKKQLSAPEAKNVLSILELNQIITNMQSSVISARVQLDSNPLEVRNIPEQHTKPTLLIYEFERFRLQTFSSWPKLDIVSPESLARDGLIYTGLGDRVKCVFCDGLLRTWERDSVAAERHKRHFPHCPFVMGYDVGNVPIDRDPRRNLLLGSQAPIVGNPFNGNAEVSSYQIADCLPNACPTPEGSYSIDPREVRARLDTPHIRILMRMGYTITQLTTAIELRLRATGDDFHSLPEFFTAMVNMNCGAVSASVAPTTILFDPVTGSSASAAAVERSSNVAETDVSHEVAHRLDIPWAITSCSLRHSNSFGNDQVPLAPAYYQRTAAASLELSALAEEKEEHRRLLEAHQCKVCMDQQITIVLLPCGHACACADCATRLLHCPLCRVTKSSQVTIANLN